ncbi:hypothetical protein [Nocardia miyunensis]|uniref:hypothetical protein n=1 Tax=Nocardia miyunensis TaxID=282684 RepID=UPI00082F3254|nr:hypothetical protein [Nocardia miyunensis]
MNTDRVSEVLTRIARANAAIHATGELNEIGREGRAPSRSEAFRSASEELHAAKQARNRLFVELASDSETVPLELAERFGLTGREAATLVEVARGGPRRLRGHLFGELDTTQVVWTSDSHNRP